MKGKIAVLGVSGDTMLRGDGWPGRVEMRIIGEADLIVGGVRHLEAAEGSLNSRARCVAIGRTGISLAEALDTVASEPGRVCVLASGDPGFFGILRILAERFGTEALDVRPAPSSPSLAFARLGIPWDDAIVVSAHGRPLAEAAIVAARHAKVAVLTDPTHSTGEIASALISAGAFHEHAAVLSSLGSSEECIRITTLKDLASEMAGSDSLSSQLPIGTALGSPDYHPVSVLALWSGTGIGTTAVPCWPPGPQRVEWGRPVDSFEHHAGMVTKPEVRSVVLSRLALAPAGVLWDIGAGSGSVGIESALLFPYLSVTAVDHDLDACERIKRNATAMGASVTVIAGSCPECLDSLPPPDSVFVGGGGIDLLETIVTRTGPTVRVVATLAALDRAVEAYRILGNLCEVSVSRAVQLPDGGIRLSAENPVFVAWGSQCR